MTKSMKRIHGREAIAKALGEHYSRKMNGKVWSAWDESKRAYSIQGEGLPAHPDLKDKYPNGWSMLDYIAPSKAREILKADGWDVSGWKNSSARESKCIHKVVIERMVDDSPDTSWLGEYSSKRTSEFTIDRAHDLDCPQQAYNRKNSDRCMMVVANTDLLQRAIDHLGNQKDACVNVNQTDNWKAHAELEFADLDDAQAILSECQDEIQDTANDCTCGNESDDWNGREYRYFNPSGNYKDETPENTAKYVRQDYERMEALNRGDFCFIGIRAEAQYSIGKVHGDSYLLQDLSSGGLCGIESDSDAAYLKSVEEEELAELRKQLAGIGFSQRAISAAFKDVEQAGDAR